MSKDSNRQIVMERLRDARKRRDNESGTVPSDLRVEPPATAAPLVSGSSLPVVPDDPLTRPGRFARNLEMASGVCHRTTSDAAATEALLAIVRDRDASVILRSEDDLVIRLLEGVAGGFELLGPNADRDDLMRADIGVSRATLGVSEYGTIMLESGDALGRFGAPTERNRLVSLVPEVHIAILAASDLVGTWDEALAATRRKDGHPPPTVTFATGPSRTADIELELVLGVHGPRAQHVILMEHL